MKIHQTVADVTAAFAPRTVGVGFVSGSLERVDGSAPRPIQDRIAAGKSSHAAVQQGAAADGNIVNGQRGRCGIDRGAQNDLQIDAATRIEHLDALASALQDKTIRRVGERIGIVKIHAAVGAFPIVVGDVQHAARRGFHLDDRLAVVFVAEIETPNRGGRGLRGDFVQRAKRSIARGVGGRALPSRKASRSHTREVAHGNRPTGWHSVVSGRGGKWQQSLFRSRR